MQTREIYHKLSLEYEQFDSGIGAVLYKIESVTLFIAQLQMDGKSYGTIISYISALKFE